MTVWHWFLWGAAIGFISQAPILVSELIGLWKAKRALKKLKEAA